MENTTDSNNVPNYNDIGLQVKSIAVQFAAEYAYRKANPGGTMNTPSIVYENAEKEFDKWIVEYHERNRPKP